MFGSEKYRIWNKHPGYNDPISAVSLVIGAFSTYNQYQAGQEASSQQKKAQEAQSRSTQVAAQRERLQAQREARIKRAQIVSATGVTGIGEGSSGISGATSSIGSQLGANIGYMNVQEGFAQAASKANQRAADAMSSAATWQAIGGVSQNIFQSQGGFTTIFGGNTFPKIK